MNSSFSFPKAKPSSASDKNNKSFQENQTFFNGVPNQKLLSDANFPLKLKKNGTPQKDQLANLTNAVFVEGSVNVNSNSKFALKKFGRQGTSNSQELQLQLETPKYFIQQPPLIVKEEQKKYEEEDEEEAIASKVRLIDNGIYCIGDSRYILMFDYKTSNWQQFCFNKKESDYQGALKFTCICQINMKKKEFLMTGGCNKVSKDPSNQAFRFNISNIRAFKEVQRMKNARYGHAMVYVNQLVLVIGGFNHRDDQAEAPKTLSLCEKYSIKENEWTPIAPMQQERAYFSACKIKEEFVYVFGGFQNYDTTNSIEFYNIMLDKWTLLSVSMPLKLAKYGLAKLEDNSIIICGGLLVDSSTTKNDNSTSYQCVNVVYKFDCNTLKWTKLAKLNFRRTLYSTMAVKENGQIFAIGGTVDGINEVYDIRKKKWNTCQSYTSVVGQNDLQTYAICSVNKNNDE